LQLSKLQQNQFIALSVVQKETTSHVLTRSSHELAWATFANFSDVDCRIGATDDGQNKKYLKWKMRAMTKTFMTKMCGLAQTARIH